MQNSKDPFAVEAVPHRHLVLSVFFLIDISENMAGTKIASINEALKESIKEIEEFSKKNGCDQIKIAVLSYSNETEWMYKELIPAETFVWKNLKTNGISNFGLALDALDTKLTVLFKEEGKKHSINRELLNKGFSYDELSVLNFEYVPVIILLSGSKSVEEYTNALYKLNDNILFESATKIAVPIGDDSDKQMLIDFTDNPEYVISVHDFGRLKYMIDFISFEEWSIEAPGRKSDGIAPTNPFDNIDLLKDYSTEDSKNDSWKDW